jgi:hypothetical protein
MIAILVAVAALSVGAPPSRPAFLSGEWTVQQKEDGKIGRAYHIYQLLCCFDVCSTDGCSLTVTSLNQCAPGFEEPEAFYPKVERATTDDELSVKWLPSNYAEFTWVDFETTIKLRLSYECSKRGQNSWCKVKDASGGFVKNSSILGKIIAVEYVPLRSNIESVRRKLDCTHVLLPTLSEKAAK